MQLYEIARLFWQQVLPRHQGKTILVVSHGGTIRALISTAAEIQAEHYHRIQQSNNGITILNFEHHSSSISGKIAAVNLTQHLGEVLPKLKNGKHGLRLLLLPINLPINYLENQVYSDSEKILNYLKNVELDFCLTNQAPGAQSIAELLVNSHSNPPVNLQVSREDFLHIWHQKISKSSLNNDALSTGLVVADENTISTTLSQILGVESQLSLQLNPGEISILFYPASQKKPVLQAMNIAGVF